MKHKVVVSVVSGARSELVLDFLRSLHATTAPGLGDLQVVVTVNDPARSTAEIDGCVQALGWEGVVEVARNRAPRGFAANHNSVMERSEADYYLIANDDVVVLDDAVEVLVRFMESPTNARLAVVSPLLLNPDGTVQPSTMSFPTIPRTLLSMSGMRESPAVARVLRSVAALPRFGDGRSTYWAHDRTTVVDTLAGAFVLVRTRAVAEVGYMDETSLVGGEEADWHKRMADAGWRVVLCTDARVIHIGKQTVGSDASLQLEYARGWLNYFVKHAAPWRRRLVSLSAWTIWMTRRSAARIRRDDTRRSLATRGMELSRLAWANRLVRATDDVQEGS